MNSEPAPTRMTTMDTHMELDDFKAAWQTLDARLARQDALQLELLRGQKQAQARRNLRPLVGGQVMQILLGIGLIVVGVACWSRNPDAITLFATGIAVHVFGVLNIIMAGITLGQIARVDYSAPVMVIQKQYTRLLQTYLLNGAVCGFGWWLMWMPVTMAFAGIAGIDLVRVAPSFLFSGIAISLVGLVGTWWWAARSRRGPRDPLARMDDGADGIRRSLRVYGDLERFERE